LIEEEFTPEKVVLTLRVESSAEEKSATKIGDSGKKYVKDFQISGGA